MPEPTTDDTLAPSPLLDRDRVAEAIRRGVRLELNPVTAKAAVYGMPVELTEGQSLAVADAALAALVAAHPVDAKKWLIEANRDWQRRNDNDNTRWRGVLAIQRRSTDNWRAITVAAWAGLLASAGKWQWHWPQWAVITAVVTAIAGGVVLRTRLLARDRRKAGAR